MLKTFPLNPFTKGHFQNKPGWIVWNQETGEKNGNYNLLLYLESAL